MLSKHGENKLTQEIQKALLFACDHHPQPPGIDGASAQAPGVDAKPPLPDPVHHPARKKIYFFKSVFQLNTVTMVQ